MSRELPPPVLPVLSVSLVDIELPTAIKNESPESEIVEIGIDDILDSSESEEEIIPDVKGIDIVYHPVCQESIKSEIIESYHYESVETQVLVNAENSPFIKTENIIQRNKIKNTSNENVTKDTGQAVVEVQGLNEYSNVLSNIETDTQLGLNSFKDLSGIIGTRSRKAKHPEKTKFAKCYKTVEATSWKKYKEKIKVIKAPVILVEAHEYTSFAKDRHVCNHCQYACNNLNNLKRHIKQMHREVATIYQCPHCSYKSKWSVRAHIIEKHKDTKDIEWFQCNLCEIKFKLKGYLTRHMKNVHLKHKQMQDRLALREKRHDCDKCNYKTDSSTYLKRHNLVHLKPEEIEYFYCYHCSHKYKNKQELKRHIFRQHFKNSKHVKSYHCEKCDYKTYASTNLKRHKLSHLKVEEIHYFYCYHCSYKAKQKGQLKEHIFRHHFQTVKQAKSFRHHCDKCDYKTYSSTNLKSHKLTHLKPEEIQYLYCYHCSYKAKQKGNLKEHIFKHFKNEEIRFHCYICDFVRLKRDLIIEHIRKHFKNGNNYDETISKYQPESRINNLKKKVSK